MKTVKDKLHKETIIIAGYGGQGILFGGLVLSQSAMNSGLHTTFFPAYGAEIRGGTANCTVVLSTTEIGSPFVVSPDSLIIMNDVAVNTFLPRLKPGGLIIVNTSLFKNQITRTDIKVVSVPATELAEQSAGLTQSANLLMLGIYIKQKGIIPLDNLLQAAEFGLRYKANLIPANQQAIKCGYNYL